MSTLTPTPTNPNPISPKTIAAGIGALLLPVLLAGVLAGLGYLLTDEGRTLLAGLPVIVQVIILAAASSLGAALAAYKVRDPLRAIGTAVLVNKSQLPDVLGKTPDQVADDVAARLAEPRRAYVDPDVPPAE